MKTRITIYSIFGAVCVLCISLYFVNPNNPVLQVAMSFGASLIGAIFVAVTLEAITGSKQKHSVKEIQHLMLSSTKQSFKSFYLWLGNYLVRKFNVQNFEFENISTSSELYSRLFGVCNEKINGSETSQNLENIIDVISTKINPLLDSIEKLIHIINEEVATLITNEVLDEEDVSFFNNLKTHLVNAQSSESFDELSTELVFILEQINTKQFLSLAVQDLLTEHLIRKFSMPN